MAAADPIPTKRVQGRSPTRLALRRLKRNRLAMVGLAVVGVIVVLGLAPGLFAPHPFAEQYPEAFQMRPLEHPDHLLGTDEDRDRGAVDADPQGDPGPVDQA